MAPSAVEDAPQTNAPPTDSHWTPETVLATLPRRPEEGSSTPLPFFHLIERLKTTKREGWRRFGINYGESISDHMYRMAIITMLCPPALASRLDISRCTRMALIHDMAETLVGDITPVDGVSKVEKSRREAETMDYLCTNLLSNVHKGSGQAQSMRDVWQEYEDSATEESKFVHDVDKLELLLQMNEYERSHEGRIDLGEFSHVANRIVLPEMKSWAGDLLAEREAFWRSQEAEQAASLDADQAVNGQKRADRSD
ncbi:hypothetical protein BAUCODRAFT_125194 [Baudoinia panamericana UAMH 10762]|uniref:5'-deoxynucleotidase n=1 Tax=Baudoinia panamericana (strain UAMH 10762) TaxID=717646 RepID=M2LGT8_BAUPA|nr:uncharacterized protein BAUCODRAFT_125194 [Baudoinia panamericana UAMH 10762]EMC93322.1 hypothetical protein BAUCODRAFT_125194 [Baudoinia panamericana UAMH 10762]